MNLALSLLYAAERTPDAEAVVEGDTRLSYKKLRKRAARLAGGLEREGLRRGDRLAAVVRCRNQSVQLYWAASGWARRSSRSPLALLPPTSPIAARTPVPP